MLARVFYLYRKTVEALETMTGTCVDVTIGHGGNRTVTCTLSGVLRRSGPEADERFASEEADREVAAFYVDAGQDEPPILVVREESFIGLDPLPDPAAIWWGDGLVMVLVTPTPDARDAAGRWMLPVQRTRAR